MHTSLLGCYAASTGKQLSALWKSAVPPSSGQGDAYIKNTYLLHIEQRPSCEANKFSTSQEIPRILWNPKVHYRSHKCPPLVPILSQLDPVHTPTPHFLKIRLNTVLPSKPRSPKRSLSFRFPHQNPVYASHFLSPPRALHAPPISFSSLLIQNAGKL